MARSLLRRAIATATTTASHGPGSGTSSARGFEIDRKNPYDGKIKFGGFGEGFFTSSEGVLLRSSNLTAERDPAKLTWESQSPKNRVSQN